MDEAFCATPPAMHPDDLLGPPPGSILLQLRGYISPCTNATTAEGFSLTTNRRIKVTLWAAHPPRPSYFTVYSRDLEPSAAFRYPPKIVNTEDDLLLLRVPDSNPWAGCDSDYFVYHAGADGKRPSLDLVPAAPTLHFSDYQVGLLRRRDLARDIYFVAILKWAVFGPGGPWNKYYLHLYSFEMEALSTKLMTCLDPRPKPLLSMSSNKVITIGGELGSLGWVDLWRGILICDVLLDNRELRYIPLSSPAVRRPLWLHDAAACRDIIVLQWPYLDTLARLESQCYIKYFEMCLSADGGWEAVEWRRWEKWKKHRAIKVSVDLGEAEIKEQLPTLKPYSGLPALSLHDAGVVYIMHRHGYKDKDVRVIAVDMRNQTLKS